MCKRNCWTMKRLKIQQVTSCCSRRCLSHRSMCFLIVAVGSRMRVTRSGHVETQSDQDRVRVAHEVTVLEELVPTSCVENTWSGPPPLTSSGHKSYPFRLGRRFVYCLSPDQGESSVQPLDRVLGRPSWLTIQVEGGMINFSPSPLPYGVPQGACLTGQQPR